MSDEELYIKSAEELAEEDVKVMPEPYKKVSQACKICGSPLKDGEKVICKNCVAQNN